MSIARRSTTWLAMVKVWVAGVVFLGIVGSSAAATVYWTGGGAGDDNWSTGLNWSDAGDPGGDDIVFNDVDMSPSGTVNSVVDTDYGVRSMNFTNKSWNGADAHTIQIGAARTLTVTNMVNVGFRWVFWPADTYNSNYITAVFTGGGKLIINSNLQVYNTGAGTARPATMDASGLSELRVNTGASITIGAGNASMGDLTMAPTNVFTARYLNIGQGSSSSPRWSYMRLGNINVLNVDTGYVASSRLNGALLFRPGLVNPLVTIRNRSGTGRAYLAVGHTLANPSQDIYGMVDLTGGIVDALLTNLDLGIGNYTSDSSLYAGDGTFTMNVGTVDVVNVRLGYASRGSNTTTQTAQGTLNMGGGLFVAQQITMADDQATLHDKVTGIINLTNGLLRAGTIARGGGNGLARFNWIGGTLQNYDAATDLNVSNLLFNLKAPSNHVVLVDASRTVTFDANASVTNNGNLVKDGPGTLVFNGLNNYTGVTAISNGTLLVNGSHTNAGDYVVVAPGAVGGSGLIDVRAGKSVSVGSGAGLKPGASVGALAIDGDLTLAATAQTYFELAPGGYGDRVSVTGNLTLAGTLNVTNVGGKARGLYTIFTYTGTLTDLGPSLQTPPGVGGRIRHDTSASPKQVNLELFERGSVVFVK